MQRTMSRQPTTSLIMPWLWSPDDLLGEGQAVLAALADLECRYAGEPSAADMGEPERAERERRHQQEREPYLRRLNALESRIQALTSGR